MLTTTIHNSYCGESCANRYQQGSIYPMEDIYTANLNQSQLNLLAQFQIRANLVVPILIDPQHSKAVDSRSSKTSLNSQTGKLQTPTLWGLLIAHQCVTPRQWKPFEIDLLASLASQLAIAIQQAQLYKQTKLQARREQALNRFTGAIRKTLDLDTIFATAALEISQLLQVDQVEIQQYLPSSQVWLTVTVSNHHLESNSLGIEVPDVENEISRQLKRLEVARIDDTNVLEDAISRELAQIFPGAWLLVPLHFQGRLWGNLCLMISDRAYHWKDSEVELVSEIAVRLAIAIHQAQLHQQVRAYNTDFERQVQERTVELQQKIQELQKLNLLKDDFLSTVSHELQTPLANMKMAIQMLKLTPKGEHSQRYLEILQAECNREADLSNYLLDLQQLEADSYPISLRGVVNLQDWLPKIVEPFRSRLQEHRQTLELELPPDLPQVISSITGLGRILAKLLNNACKYTPVDGKIVLGVRYHPIELLDVAAQSRNGIVTFSISNQSEISATELARIFEKFYRVPGADPWKQGGTGLGLALVQKLVQQLGGTIQVESGNGWTTFTVQLPTNPNLGAKCFGVP